MEILPIMDMSKTIRKLIQSKGYKIKVNENSFLVFESKKHYRNIKRLEKLLFHIINYVIINGVNKEVYEREREREFKLKCKYKYGCEYESESESESESEKLEHLIGH